MSSDLVILGAAASQLFECTRDMSREAVVSLLSGLRDVSLRNIPAAFTTAVGQQMPKLFALNRMVEVLLYNINRIYDLWAIFLRCGCCLLRLLATAAATAGHLSWRWPGNSLFFSAACFQSQRNSLPPACLPLHRSCSHVLEVMNDPKPSVRAAAIEALGRAISGALGSLSPPQQSAAAAGEEAAGGPQQPLAHQQYQQQRLSSAASDSTGGVEHMLLVALEALYNGDKERDVRSGVLRVLLNVLQVTGQLCWGAKAMQTRPQRHTCCAWQISMLVLP